MFFDRPEVHLLEHVRPTVEVLDQARPEAVVERRVQDVAKALASEPSSVDRRLQKDVDQLGAPADRVCRWWVLSLLLGHFTQVLVCAVAQFSRFAPVPSIEPFC